MDPSIAVPGAAAAARTLVDRLRAGGFADKDARAPSLLPGWSRGHLLTHVARNADGLLRMVDGAAAGTVADQYPGGDEQRATEIDAGAGRPADELLADVADSADALAAGFAGLDPVPGGWAASCRRWGDQPWPIRDVPFLRWREVALHSVDLGWPGLDASTWGDPYAEAELHRLVGALGPRLAVRQIVEVIATDLGWSTLVIGARSAEPAPAAVVQAPARDLVLWLTGRAAAVGAGGWPDIGAWSANP